MNIKNKLYVSAGVSIVLVVTLLSVVLVTSGRVAEESKKHELLNNVCGGVAELDILTYDYLLHREERMEHQWNIKYDSLGEILDGLAEEEELKSIRTDYATLGTLFSQITANYEKRQEYIQKGASQEKIDVLTGLEERLVAQLLITSHSIFTDAAKLAEEAHTEATEAQRVATNLTVILMIVLVIAITTSSLIIARSISKPLTELTKGAGIIGTGDLEHKVDIQSKDELGELAMAFNKMTGSLKEITASRDELDREITERKRAEEELQAVSLYTRTLIEASLDPLVTISADGKITDVNKATEMVTGVSRERLIGSDFSSYFTEPQKAKEGYEQVFSKGFIRDYPLIIRHTSGQTIDVLYNAVVYRNEAGDVQGVVAAARDITERKQAEEELLKSSVELTAVNKELEAFAYSVSHDLRAPLRSIDGFSQALMEDYPDKLDEQGKGYLQRVRSAAQRMAVLIDDLLSLSRVTRSDMRRETVDLSALAQSIAEDLQETEPERQVDIVIAPGLTTSGDSQLLHQLMENLLGNAWKFTGHHPRAKIEFGISQIDGKETFFVRDNGAGFDMTYADKLFGVFQRLHSQEEFPGTGVGLATVQRIAHRHGGQVWVEGKVEEGATFYFKLK